MKRIQIDESQQHVKDNADYAEMVLEKSLYDFRLNQILNGIEQSLETRNKEEFLRLTEELKIIKSIK